MIDFVNSNNNKIRSREKKNDAFNIKINVYKIEKRTKLMFILFKLIY